FDYIARYGVNTDAIKKSGIPLIFGIEINFRIRSTGRLGNANREITAVTYDLDNLRDRYLNMLDNEAQKPSGGGPPGGPGTPVTAPKSPEPAADEKPKIVAPKGRPTVVYWD